jgi:hypothetical protein
VTPPPELSPGAALDLDARVVYLPVRHHSPACAFHVERVISAVRPTAVLIEGPRDATPLLEHLVHPDARPPVAIYTAFVDRRAEGLPRRHGAYYPLCDYSPELAAIRAARAVGAAARFIDLTYPEMVLAERKGEGEETPGLRNLQEEMYLRRSRLLAAACRRAAARDSDDLWDCLFEHDFRHRAPAEFFAGVWAWCALARADYTSEMLAAEIHDVREPAMRAEIDEAAATGRVVVVTGGFHAVALPATTARRPPVATLARPEDASVTLMRYGFVQLDSLNGYASGMPSPEFYQRLWEDRDPLELMVALGRDLREHHGAPSAADASAAAAHARALARFRRHGVPTREDFLDAVRSVFIKGADDVEGVAVLAAARKLLAGERVGAVPPSAGRPPLVLDFERVAESLRLSLEVGQAREVPLDLYRSALHRAKSRFLHRLRLLGVPYGHWLRGPDYVEGADLDRVQELWKVQWQPATEARLVEESRYGATVEEAATAHLLEQMREAERGDGRADAAARLLLAACRAGLHRQAPALLDLTVVLIAGDPSFRSVMRAALELDLLRVSREPLEAHHLVGLEEAVRAAWERATGLVPGLTATAEEEEGAALDALCSWSALVASLPDPALAAQQRAQALQALAAAEGNPVLLGAAAGLLFDDGDLPGAEIARRLAGRLAAGGPPGARFLRGLLRTARSVCWREPGVVEAVHRTLRELSEPGFIESLPHLRLAFADLTPRECDRVAALVGAESGPVLRAGEAVTEAALLLGLRVDRLVGEILGADFGASDA